MCIPWDKVTEEYLASALAIDKGDEAALVSWSFKALPGTFSHQRIVEVKYTLEGQESVVTYSVKCVGRGPNADECHALLFEKEYGFYQEVAPALNALLQETGQRSLRFAQCFTHVRTDTYEVMVLEDLTTRGFCSVDRRFDMDLAHAITAIQDLGRLHAASWLLQKRNADKPLAQTYPFLGKEWTKTYKRGGESYEDILKKNIDLGVALIEATFKRERDINWLKKIRPTVWQIFLEQLEISENFAVICHGDGWSTNILYRYDSMMGRPVEAIFVDLQQVRIASPCTDIHALIAPNLASPVRLMEHYSMLLAYQTSFRNVLEAGGVKAPFDGGLLEDEYRDKTLYGILSALMYMPLSPQKYGGRIHPLSEEAGALIEDKEKTMEVLKKDDKMMYLLRELLDEMDRHDLLE